MLYEEIPKRTRNAIRSRIQSAEEKYGFEVVRRVAVRYFDEVKKKQKLVEDIAEKETELRKLKEDIG